MTLPDAAIDFAVEYHTHSNARATGPIDHTDHAGLRFSAAPVQFAQGGGIGIVFLRPPALGARRQELDRVTFPSRQIVYCSQRYGYRIYLTGAAHSGSGLL